MDFEVDASTAAGSGTDIRMAISFAVEFSAPTTLPSRYPDASATSLQITPRLPVSLRSPREPAVKALGPLSSPDS